MLVGTEVKSLRAGHCSLDGAWARVEDNEVWLVGCDIPEYVYGNRLNHKPKRDRKLLLHKREIAKFADHTAQRGLTIVPVSVYFKDGRAKVEIAVGRGKQLHDKRESIKEREADRAIRQSGRRTAR
jgi:SsrA-binding protein